MPTSRRVVFCTPSSVFSVVTVSLTFLLVGTAGVAHAGGDTEPPPTVVRVPIHRAGVALGHATADLKTNRHAAATKALAVVRRYVARAHGAGMRQIGAPPSDPESDVGPGPVSVLAVLDFEHTVVVRAAQMLDGQTQAIGVGKVLTITMRARTIMLKRITSLDPEGDGGDYSDDMADTVPTYTDEVAYLTAVLSQAQLTQASRRALQRAIARSKQTLAIVDAAYGGGE
jgi:hypothetical protein